MKPFFWQLEVILGKSVKSESVKSKIFFPSRVRRVKSGWDKR